MSTRKKTRSHSTPGRRRTRSIRRTFSLGSRVQPNQARLSPSPEHKFSPVLFRQKPRKTRRWFSRLSPNSPYKQNDVLTPNYLKDTKSLYNKDHFAPKTMRYHLDTYLKLYPSSTYEEWVNDYFTKSDLTGNHARISSESLTIWKNKQKMLYKEKHFKKHNRRKRIQEHLDKYIKLRPTSTYEEWVQQLAPRAVLGHNIDKNKIILDDKLNLSELEISWRNKRKQLKKYRNATAEWVVI